MNNTDKISLPVTIENKKGSYKSFEVEGDPLWKGYPLKGVTYPVDYGSIAGYTGEDGADLDVFVGSGEHYGYITVSRMDVPVETKFFMSMTEQEIEAVHDAFAPVLLTLWQLSADEFENQLQKFKNK